MRRLYSEEGLRITTEAFKVCFQLPTIQLDFGQERFIGAMSFGQVDISSTDMFH